MGIAKQISKCLLVSIQNEMGEIQKHPTIFTMKATTVNNILTKLKSVLFI